MKSGLVKAIAVVLLAAVLLLVNFLAARLPARGDLTAGKIYTLSEGTRSLLGKIEEPVSLRLYASHGVAGLPVSYKNYADRVEEMLRAYVRASSGHLSLEVISPSPDTPEEERAQAAGLQPQQVPGSGEPFYLGLVVTQADQQKALPTFSPDREELLEYDISSLLNSVQQLNKPKLGVFTRLQLAGEPYNMMMMQQGRRPTQAQLILEEWKRSYDVVTIDTDFTTLPSGLAALAVLHPAGIKPAQEFAVDQFLLSGKPVLVAVDPSSSYFKRQGGQQAMFGGGSPDVSSDLPTLFKAYGVTYDSQQVVGDQELATQVNAGNGQIARMPVWLSLAAKNLNSATPATAQLKSLLFVEPGSVSVETRQGREITPLIESSATAGTVPASTLQFSGPDEVSRTLVAGTAKKNLAVLIRGPFTSAFPKGAPKADSAADKPADPAKPAASSLKSGSGTLVVIADTDWLLDDFSVRRQAIFGQEMVEPLNDNLFFGSNLIDFLAGSPDLIALRGKRSAQRPFEVVARMEADAQKQFNSKLAALETRIASVQSKLAELQRKSPDGGRLVATPEVLKTIEEFQAQELSMRRERRDIRRSLRVGIDALETKLLVINLLASPVLLGFFGVWFTRHRRHAA
ncbi:ABC transporter [Verrucomicrobia bacterium IMCC26134]|nr:ABC transporter [Verrucomicrobia bacterium IMCC26134]